jgi:hypothetical protein
LKRLERNYCLDVEKKKGWSIVGKSRKKRMEQIGKDEVS